MSGNKNDSEQLIGCALSSESLIELLCDTISVELIEPQTSDNGSIVYKSKKGSLPTTIAEVITLYLEIPLQRKQFRVGDELWVRCDSKDFRSKVAYLQISYPWAQLNRKLNKDTDAYCEGLELYMRYRPKFDFRTVSGLHESELKMLRSIVGSIDNRASKSKPKDLVTFYGLYMLHNSMGVSTTDVFSTAIGERKFGNEWETYGDDIERLSHDLEPMALDLWRECIPKIQHFKAMLLPEIVNTLYSDEIEPYKRKVRRVHITADTYRDDCKSVYDLYISPTAVLFQKMHTE